MNTIKLLLYRTSHNILPFFPERVLVFLSRLLGTIIAIFSKERCDYVYNSLAKITKDNPQRSGVLSRFSSYSYYLIEWLSSSPLTRKRIRDKWEWMNKNYLDELLDNKKGAILLTGHTGNWECMGWQMIDRGYPLHVLASKHETTRLTGFFASLRPGEIVHHQDEYMGGVYRAVQKGAFLAALIDGDVVRGTQPAEFSFFGQNRKFETFPVRLAYRLKVPVIPFFSEIVSGFPRKYRAKITAPVFPDDLSEEMFIKVSIEKYISELEKVISNKPSSWHLISSV